MFFPTIAEDGAIVADHWRSRRGSDREPARRTPLLVCAAIARPELNGRAIIPIGMVDIDAQLGIRGGTDGPVGIPDPILGLGAVAIPELQLLAVDIVAVVHVEALIVLGVDCGMIARGRLPTRAVPPAGRVPLLSDLAIALLKNRRIAIVEIGVAAA
jgi:hypothetical protein